MNSAEAALNSPTKFSTAIQITRPRSATTQGTSSSLVGSPVNQIKVAKLVLKPAQSLSNNKTLSPQKRAISAPGSITTCKESRPLQLHNNKTKTADESRYESSVKKYHRTLELENTIRKAEREKKTMSKRSHEQQQQQSGAVSESSPHKSSAMDEAARKEAREFMKRQREKRKLETTKKVVDKSFVIRERLDELRKTTRKVIVKKPSSGKSQVKISPPKDFYSLNSLKIREIKVLRLKPMTNKGSIVQDDVRNQVENHKSFEKVEDQMQTSDRRSFCESPVNSPSPLKVQSPVKKLSTHLQPDNKQNLSRPESAPKSRPTSSLKSRLSSSKENKKPEDDLKLKVPDLKLSMSAVNRTELPSAYQSFLKPQPNVPFWLENTAVQPYPYNFIWAVRKKLEAYTSSSEDAKRVDREKSRGLLNMETPRVAKRITRSRDRKFPDFLSKHFADDTKHELQRPTISDDSKANQLEQDGTSEANTISEISSIQSDLVLTKSKSQENDQEQRQFDDDDTTISESIFHSVKDDIFIRKKRESFKSELSLTSLGKELVELHPSLSPNTSEKRVNFLSSTTIAKAKTEDEKAKQNDLDKNKLDQEKEQEYQKMLTAFNQSLSHVIEVNHLLTSALSSKSSVGSAPTSETVKNYTSSFENNPESESAKTSDKSNISEMIDNLVQQTQPAQLAAAAPAVVKSASNSSIETLLEDSKSNALKPVIDDAIIEDPPIVYNEPAQEFSSSSTKVTTTTTTKIVQQQKVLMGKKEDQENTLNDSRLINIFRLSESETSFNIVDNNTSFGLLMEKSSSEIKSWERTLTERTRGQIAWLELQKQNFRKHGQLEKVSAIKKQQRAILLRLEKERSKLRENSEKPQKINLQESPANDVGVLDKSLNLTANESEARENIERILQQREEKLAKRRTQVENLIDWQRRLDKEEEKLRQMEKYLLGENMSKASHRKKKSDEDFSNTSIEMVKSIDKSLKALDSIQAAGDDEIVDVSGAKLNKLWKRLTGIDEILYQPMEVFRLNKQNFAQFYEEAKEVVLQSDLKLLLETSVLPQPLAQPSVAASEAASIEKPSEKKETENTDVDSDDHDRTLNSIANIETEEEFPGSQPYDEPETETITTTENDEDLHKMMANQMKVFLEHKLPLVVVDDAPIRDTSDSTSALVKTPTIGNATFKVSANSADELDKSTSTVGVLDMDFEQDSLIQTEPLLSIDNSSVDGNGFIIPEMNEIQITDMDMDQNDFDEYDDDANDGQLIEDISFPNLELSISDETAHQSDERRKDLSTISECTEYEQSQGSSDEQVSSEIVSRSSTATTSERVNSEVEQRLISINDSLEDVNKALNKVIVNRSPSTMTYSTDKDFAESASTPESRSEKSDPRDLLMFSPINSRESVNSYATTSTPKILMPDILSEVSDSRKEDDDVSEDF